MAYQDHKESTRRANDKYDAKTYKRMMLRLRNDEDSDIIESLREAQANGKTNREWLREVFEGK